MRIKRAIAAKKKRKKVLKSTKGFYNTRKSCYKKAKEALIKAGKNAYKDRRTKKRRQRALWQIQIGNACRLEGLSYSKFIGQLKVKKIEVDRKILAKIANEYPAVFKEIVVRSGNARQVSKVSK